MNKLKQECKHGVKYAYDQYSNAWTTCIHCKSQQVPKGEKEEWENEFKILLGNYVSWEIEGTTTKFRLEQRDGLIDFISHLLSTQKEEMIKEISKNEGTPKSKGKIICNCPCKGPFCNSLSHKCDKPNNHIPQRDIATIEIRNKLRKELRRKLEILQKGI